MINKLFAVISIISLSFLFQSFDVAKGWYEIGNEGGYYTTGSVKGEGVDGKTCATIKSVKPSIKGFVDLIQEVSTSLYAGKKIKLSVYMKAEHIGGKKWNGFWIKIDDKVFNAEITKDVKEKGTWSSGWKKYEIVADVPEKTKTQFFSIACRMYGTGQVWFDNISIDAVDGTTNASGIIGNGVSPKEPVNLDFEQ